MLRSILGLACLLWVLWPLRSLAAAQVRPAFVAVGEQRLFQAEVITEVQLDRTGFLWIGTREGLFLHDGERFRKFQHEVGNPDSISSNGIRGVFEDSRGRLWVNTISGGLNLLDRSRWRFVHYNHTGKAGGLSHDGVFALAEGAQGRLWVGTQAGLDELDPATGLARAVPLQGKGGEFVMCLLRDRGGRLWVGTLGQGLFRSDDAGGFVPVTTGAGGARLPEDIFSIAQDEAGRLWVGARDGLYRVGTGGALEDVALQPATAELVNITQLTPAPGGSMWIGTFGAGLFRLDTGSGAIAPVDLGRSGAGAQHIDQGALLVDRQGGLVIGTFGAGLLRRPPSLLDIRSYRAGDAGAGLRGEDIYAVLADDAGLLVGSFGGGVQRIDVARGTVNWLDPPSASDTRLDGVVAMQRALDGSLWVGTSGGLYRRRVDGGVQDFPVPSGSPGAANPGYVYALLEDRQGRLWVGSGGAGLYRYRPGRDDFLVYRPDVDDPRSLSDDFVSALLEDRRGRLWVGTRSGGINICTVAGEHLQCQRLVPGAHPHAPSHRHVAVLLEAPDGAIWVGTGGGGLNRIDFHPDGRIARVRVWTRADGLVDDNVMALAYAPDRALWISTRVGLSRLDPTGGFDNYTVADGLPTAVFNPKALAWLDGRLYLGGTHGVISVDPAQWRRPWRAPPTVLTAIDGLDAKTALPAPPWRLARLRVPWRQPFSLEFAVLSFDGGEAEYEYRLRDEEPWVALGNRSQLTLHGLDAGQYRVSVRGRHAGTAWTTTTPLQLEIVPPWWRNAWLRAGAVALAFAMVLLAAVWRVRVLQGRNRELQAMQRQKDVALAQARESRDDLEAAFERLRGLTMQLEAAKEAERKHLSRELHDEFGQALTAAKINLRLALADRDHRQAEVRIRDTVSLVERLIAQVRALSLDLRPPLLDELGLVPALEGYLSAVAERSGVPIRYHADPDLPVGGIERAIMLFRIVQEAVTNALRHANAAQLQVTLRRRGERVDVEIADDGRGFDVEAVMAEGGKRFGLFGMRERVRDLGGEFVLASAPGGGTRVQAGVPGGFVDNEGGGHDAHRPGR